MECAQYLIEQPQFSGKKILLVGLQPRFLEYLVKQNTVRVLDLDADNVGTEKFGVRIESGDNFEDALQMAKDALFTSVDFYREEDRTLPPPSECQEGEIMIALDLALK